MNVPPIAPSFEELEKKGAALNAFAFGLVSFITGLLMLLCTFFSPLVSWIPGIGFMMAVLDLFGIWVYLIAIIMGAVALSKAKKGAGLPKAKQGKVFGTLGLVFGIVGIVLTIVLIVLAILAVIGVFVVGGIIAAIAIVLSMMDPEIMAQIEAMLSGADTYITLLAALL